MTRGTLFVPSSASGLFFLLFRVGTTVGQAVDLGGGLVTRTDVRHYADITLDVRDIQQATTSDDALLIYNSGQNAQKDGNRWSFLAMHSEMRDATLITPEFAFHQYGLAELTPNEADFDKDFAKDYVLRSIQEGDMDLTADAILALTVWQYSMHLLYKGVMDCDVRSQADDPTRVELGGGGLDEFIALWIGAYQTPATKDGFSLYTWTERVAEKFDTDDPEAQVNLKIKVLYQEGAVALSLSGACSTPNSKTVGQLYRVAIQIANQMMIPLYQWLIVSLQERNVPATELYAQALIPQLSQCRPSQFTLLREALLDESIDFGASENTIRALLGTLPCFNLDCDDIGTLSDELMAGCPPADSSSPTLAGFTTSSSVNSLSRMDLDVYQIGVLSQLHSWEYAKLLYKYGRNAPVARDSENDPFTLHSLQSMATSAHRKALPFYANFINYQQANNNAYGDSAVLSALEGNNAKWTSNAQRAAAIKALCAYQIIFLETMGLLSAGFAACESEDSEIGYVSAENPLDQAAALLIGYMEGSQMRGTPVDGQLLFNLANKRAFTFETITSEDHATVNDEIEDLLYAAKGQLDALDCLKVERTTTQIRQYMLIPIIQSMLINAVYSEDLPTGSTDAALVEGEIFATTVLPFMNELQPATGATVQSNMIVSGTDTVPDGAAVVGEVSGMFVAHGLGISCAGFLGNAQDIQPCRNYSSARSSSLLFVGLSTAVSLILMAISL